MAPELAVDRAYDGRVICTYCGKRDHRYADCLHAWRNSVYPRPVHYCAICGGRTTAYGINPVPEQLPHDCEV